MAVRVRMLWRLAVAILSLALAANADGKASPRSVLLHWPLI